MQTTNLQTLRSLRTQEKAIKVQIDAIIDAATHRGHGRLRRDLQTALPGQTTRRDQTDGQVYRLKEKRSKEKKN